MQPPFSTKLAQVAIVVRDIDSACRRYAALLGCELPKVITTQPGDEVELKYRGKPSKAQAKLAFFDLQGVQLELIEPLAQDSAWAEGLDSKGERVHHLAFWTEDMRISVEHLAANGAPLVMRGDMGGGQYAYFDGQDNFGCFFELLEEKKTPLEEPC